MTNTMPEDIPGNGNPAESAGASHQYGAATESKIKEVMDTCTRYGESSIIALSGVPGTGKSYVGRIAAQRLAGDPLRVREIQFHQSTTYEEFVEGLRIDSSGAITVAPGLFLEWNDYATDDPSLSLSWVLLVEELTRANISAVLGELMTFLEDRSRPFTTTYSRRPVKVARNIILLGTYNPTDRSALEIDAALLRRMRVIEFPPDEGQLQDMLSGTLPQKVIERIKLLFETVKEKHPAEYEYQMPFGHGIFAEIRQEMPDLNQLWEERIRYILRRPLVQPHPFYDTIRAAYPWTSPDFSEPL